jgi:hypothetical protein
METETSLEDLSLIAADEARDVMADLGIKDSTCSSKVEVIARVKFKLPNAKCYFMNSKRINAKEVALKTKYPGVTFDFDIEFTHKG